MKQHKFSKLLVVALTCALACVTAVGLTACGGESDEDQIKDYLNDYFGTLQNLDSDMIDEIESELSSDATFGTYISDGTIDVEEYMDHLFGRMEYEIGDIEVDGDTATVEVTISNPDLVAAMTAAQDDLYAMDQDELAQIYSEEGESGLVKQMMTFFYEEEEKQDVQEMGTVTIDMKKDSEDGWEFADEDQASSDVVNVLLGE
jgi:hypothetical protein